MIEAKLSQQGRTETLSLKNDILKGYLSGLGHGRLYNLLRKPLQHTLNNHMVSKGGWKRTDDVTDIELPTKRRCLRKPRNSSSSNRKNLQGKIQNQNHVAVHKVKEKLSKPVVPNNRCVQPLKNLQAKIQSQNLVEVPKLKKKQPKPVFPEDLCAQASLKRKSRPKLLVSAPPRRSKRLREQAGCILDGISVLNNVSFRIPKKKKRRYNVKRKKNASSTLTFSQRAMRRDHGFWIVEIVKDSNSIFRAFAHQLYGNEDLHAFIRERCCRYLELYRERFQVSLEPDLNNGSFQQYLDGMRNRQVRGGNLEITAMSELYERPVQIYVQHLLPDLSISDSVPNDTGLSPLRITVDNDNYYNSVVTDDHKDTVFVCDAGVFEDATLFRHAMRVERNFKIQQVRDDGNCLFGAFSHQVYGDQSFHGLIREKCCNYMELNAADFVGFIDTDTQYVDFEDYLFQMRSLGTWGGNLEITALSQLYQRPVEVYDQQTTPRNILSDSVNYDNNQAPIRISYMHGGTHYDSVVSENHGETLFHRDDAGVFEDAVLASLQD